MPPYNLAPGGPIRALAPTPASKVSWIRQGGALPVRGWAMLSPYLSHNFLFLTPHFSFLISQNIPFCILFFTQTQDVVVSKFNGIFSKKIAKNT